MARRSPSLLFLGGIALVCGAVLALRPESSALRLVGGIVLLVAGAAALAWWFRSSVLLSVTEGERQPPPEAIPDPNPADSRPD